MLIRLRPLFALLCAVALTATSASAQSLIYSSQMNNSTGWTQSDFGLGTSSAVWDFDYSALGIPEAPNSNSGDADARGVRLAANVGASFGGDEIAVIHEDAAFTGQYTVQVDAWLNWAADETQNGTTEHAGVYVGFDSSTIDSNFPAQNGAGLLWSSDGDCSNCDYILTKDEAELQTGSMQYSVDDFGFGNQNGYDNTDGSGTATLPVDFDIPTIFPSFDIEAATGGAQGDGNQPAGAAGFLWVTITAAVDTNAIGEGTNGTPGIASFTIENAASGEALFVGTVDNSVDWAPSGEAPVGMDGGIGLMLVDFFASNASNADWAFVLYDNVRVYDGLFSDTPTGDFNGDTEFDCSDIDALVAEIAAGTNSSDFDLTGDGNVNGADLDAWLVAGGAANPDATSGGNPFLPGDANLDGSVNGGDFLVWNEHKFTDVAAWCSGDFNADGSVNGGDFLIWNEHKFTSADVSAVPEPAGGLLLVMAGLFFAARREVR